MKYILNIFVVLFALVTWTDSAKAQSCKRDKNCTCAVELSKIVEGKSYDMGRVYPGAGNDPAHVFLHGGSENIPVTCRAAMYLHHNDPAWFTEYFDVQKRSDIRFMNNEIFSPGYTQQVIGAVLVVLKHAIDRGHTDLEIRASQWLKAYWAYLALGSNFSAPSKTMTSTTQNGFKSTKSKTSGFGVVVPGTRSYPQQRRGVGNQDVFLSIALDHPWRSLNTNLNRAYGVTGTLRAFLKAHGFSISSRGKPNILSRSVDPRHVGLTADERNKLNEFITSNGQLNTQYVLGLLGDYNQLMCNLTYIRTTEGIISWFGTSATVDQSCSVTKGGSYNATSRIFARPEAYFLARIKKDKNPSMGRTWRENNKICGEGPGMPKLCLDLPPGQVIHEITIDKFAGPRCIQGNCN